LATPSRTLAWYLAAHFLGELRDVVVVEVQFAQVRQLRHLRERERERGRERERERAKRKLRFRIREPHHERKATAECNPADETLDNVAQETLLQGTRLTRNQHALVLKRVLVVLVVWIAARGRGRVQPSPIFTMGRVSSSFIGATESVSQGCRRRLRAI